MSRRMVMISISCSMLMLVGVVKLVLADWQVGLLMIGFATLLWDNIRLQERLREIAPSAVRPPTAAEAGRG